MAGVPRKPDRDRSMEFQGFLKDLNDWDYLLKEKDQKLKGQANEGKKAGSLQKAVKVDEDKGPPKKVPAIVVKKKVDAISEVPSRGHDNQYNYLRYSDVVSQMPSSFLNGEILPDATSEKELGNEYFKQKKYVEAIDCYSRSIALSPTSVAFANRAMAYLKVKRFEEAENDCTEALNLDDRYVKAYSRRATARKELGKLKASMEDSEFAMRLEPNNHELRKQYTETKALFEKEIAKRNAGPSKNSSKGIQRVGYSEMVTKGVQGAHSISSNALREATMAVQTSNTDSRGMVFGKPLIAVNDIDSRSTSVRVENREQLMNGSQESATLGSNDSNVMKHHGVDRRKQNLNVSMQDLASRAASRVMTIAAKNISAPKSAYEFEVSWRTLSDDSGKQAHLLKTIPPATLPQIFKNALSAPMLIEIIRCTATFFKEDTELAVSILDNLAKVPRFDMIVMCLSAVDHSELHQIWEEVFSSKDVQADQIEALRRLRPKYCYGEWQAHILGSCEWPK